MWFNLVTDKKADSLLKWHFHWNILWNEKKSINHPPAHPPLHRDWQTRCSSQSQSFPAHKGTQKLTTTVQFSVTIFSCTQRHTETDNHCAVLSHNLFLHTKHTKAHRNWQPLCSSQSQSFPAHKDKHTETDNTLCSSQSQSFPAHRRSQSQSFPAHKGTQKLTTTVQLSVTIFSCTQRHTETDKHRCTQLSALSHNLFLHTKAHRNWQTLCSSQSQSFPAHRRWQTRWSSQSQSFPAHWNWQTLWSSQSQSFPAHKATQKLTWCSSQNHNLFLHTKAHRNWQTWCSSQSQSFPAHKGTQKLTTTVQFSVTIFSCTQRHTETDKHGAVLSHNLFLHTKAHRNWQTRCSSQSQSFPAHKGTQKLTNMVQFSVTIFFLHTKAHRNWQTRCSSQSQSFLALKITFCCQVFFPIQTFHSMTLLFFAFDCYLIQDTHQLKSLLLPGNCFVCSGGGGGGDCSVCVCVCVGGGGLVNWCSYIRVMCVCVWGGGGGSKFTVTNKTNQPNRIQI